MSKFVKAQSCFLYLIILLALSFSFSGCKENGPSFIAAAISAQELQGYYLVTEYKYTGSSTQFRGDKSFLTATFFKSEANGLHVFDKTIINSFRNDVARMEYDSASGITSLKLREGVFVKLTRDQDGNIILASKLTIFDTNAETVHTELVKASSFVFHRRTKFQAMENGAGHFWFGENAWIYKPGDTFTSLDWRYTIHSNFLWSGVDGGTTKWPNLFVGIPKGTGWKGQRKDQELMLVAYANGTKSVDGIVICEYRQY